MTFSDYVLDILLIAVVFRQLRESRFDRRAIILPLGIAAIVGNSYLHSIPTSGNDLVLVALFTGIGVMLGTISALATRVRSDGGSHALVKASWLAAGVWVASMGFRFGFSIWASHGGDAALGRFSVAHHITGGDAWTAALVLMAMGEVVTRTALLYVRSQQALTKTTTPRALASI